MAPAQRFEGRRAWIVVAVLAAACQAAPVTTPTAVANLPSAPPTPRATATPSLAPVPPGRILFMRWGSDDVERYFTVNSDGTDERALFTAQGCECAHWMADGSRVMSLGESGKDVWSLMTIGSDGSDRVVIPTPIRTLSLAAGATTLDGKWIAFNGWDFKHPGNSGLYLAHPDLTDLRQVLPLRDGMLAVEPFGVTPDGSKVVFFVDTGPEGGITHAGDVYVVSADGSGLRRLNPEGTKAGFIGPPVVSLSPDGRQAAFAAFAAGSGIYVADLEGSETSQIADEAGREWAVAWSPTGEWIAYTLNTDGVNTISLVRPDGSDGHKIPASDESDRASWGAWSPDGTALVVQNDNVRYGDSTDLWVMDLDGNLIGQVTNEPSSYGIYSWAPAAAQQ